MLPEVYLGQQRQLRRRAPLAVDEAATDEAASTDEAPAADEALVAAEEVHTWASSESKMPPRNTWPAV